MATLREAAWRGDVEMLRKGLRAGIRPDVTDDYGRTPLHYLCGPLHPQASSNTTAADDRRAACFKLLRDAGASLDAVDRDRWTPLHHAAIRANVEILTLLVEAGANVNAADSDGCTALHFAPSTRALACVEVLLAAGADIDARTSAGRRPFDLAITNVAPTHRSHRIWPLFLRAGAEIPTDNTKPYLVRVRNAGGFQRYAQAHVARIASILETPLLPQELVRKVLEFHLHAGYY